MLGVSVKAILSMLLLTSCGTADVKVLWEDPKIAPVLKPFVDEFMQGCNEHVSAKRCLKEFDKMESIVEADGYIDHEEDPKRQLVGLCETIYIDNWFLKHKFRRKITVMTSRNGKPVSPERIRETVMHEMGHCVLDLNHGQGVLMRSSSPWLTPEQWARFENLKQEMWSHAKK